MNKQTIDDQGTTEDQARQILRNLLVNGFEGDVSAAALALGRSTEEVDGFLNEETEIDEDLMVKIRGIAQNRGFEIE
jgi:hypothetical protein